MGILELLTLVMFITNLIGLTSISWAVVFAPILIALVIYLILWLVAIWVTLKY